MYRDERTTLKARLREVARERTQLESRQKQLASEIERREELFARGRRWLWLPRVFTVVVVVVVGLLVWRVYAPARRHVDQREARSAELSRARSEAKRRYELARAKAQEMLAPLQKVPPEDARKTQIFGEIRFHDPLDPDHAQLIVGAAGCALGDEAVARRAHQVLLTKAEKDAASADEESATGSEPTGPNLVALLERLCGDEVKLP